MKALLLTLLCSALACGDDVKWTAVQKVGTARDCWDGATNTRWDITEKEGRLIARADNTVDWFDVKFDHPLNADGSGRFDVKDIKGRPFWFAIEAGQGPRKIYAHFGYRACVWLLEPR